MTKDVSIRKTNVCVYLISGTQYRCAGLVRQIFVTGWKVDGCVFYREVGCYANAEEVDCCANTGEVDSTVTDWEVSCYLKTRRQVIAL